MATCIHLPQLSRLQPPKLSQSVHREECTQCFDNQDLPLGVEVCLTCFNGGCLDLDRHHARTHVEKTGHTFTLNVKRKTKPSKERGEGEEPPAKMTKLAIEEEREEDKFDHTTVIKCWSCENRNGQEISSAVDNPQVKNLVDEVMRAMSSARQSEVKAWEEEILACEHTLTLEQFATGHISASGLAHCASCELKENLWLCLTCGSLGCGRQQFGGVPGNSHALAHYNETGHGVAVKLGTITPEGNADIYCYGCNDSKLDPELAAHLSTFGINVAQQVKTEKSMTELQIEQNMNWEFSLKGEDGKDLEPVFGAGLTGIANLGNSCYMASVLQVLFSLPAFQTRYTTLSKNHSTACSIPLPADCVECQMHKIADGLLSGRYSHPDTTAFSPPPGLDLPPPEYLATIPIFQKGVRPAGFKELIGRGHQEFSTMKQQDSEEFLTHLIAVLRRDMQKFASGDRSDQDPTSIFSYGVEQRLQCNDCHKVRYRVDETDLVSVAVPATEKSRSEEEGGKIIWEDVGLWECLEAQNGGSEALEYSCPECRKKAVAIKQTKFATFPQVLVVQAKKFQLVNWVPTKLDIPVILPENDVLEFTEKHLGRGIQDGEVELPDDSAPAQPPVQTPQFNEEVLGMLEGMGFPRVRGQKALLATGNTADPEVAMNWLFEHMDDIDIDAPIDFAAHARGQAPGAGVGGAGGKPEPSPEIVAMLCDMGFTQGQAKKALRETDSDPERAVEWLFSHPDDMGDEPTPAATDATAGGGGSASVLPPATTIKGSKEVPVRYRLKAFISHKGPSVHSGHYVAHIRGVGGSGSGEQKEEGWIFFNDEKVVKAEKEGVDELKKLAYLYVFERV